MRTSYKIIIFVLLVFLNKNTISQTGIVYLSQVRLIVQSEDNKHKPFTAYVDFAYMILNLSTGDFTLNADFINIKTDNFSPGMYLYSITDANGDILYTDKFSIVK